MVRKLQKPINKTELKRQAEKEILKRERRKKKKNDILFVIKAVKFALYTINVLTIISTKNNVESYLTSLFIVLISSGISLIEKFGDDKHEATVVTRIGVIVSIIPVLILTVSQKIGIIIIEKIENWGIISIFLVVVLYIFIFLDFGFKKYDYEGDEYDA